MAGVIPDDEPIADLLRRREYELVQRICAIKNLLFPAEKELADVRKAMDALQIAHDGPLDDALSSAFALETTSPLSKNYFAELASYLRSGGAQNALTDSSAGDVFPWNLTIKQMILNALRDHFVDGATPTELSDYFHTAYGKTVNRNSISPQLARLREEGHVVQPAGILNEGKWQITHAGRWHGVPLPLRGDE
jgi:hypothetical protein